MNDNDGDFKLYAFFFIKKFKLTSFLPNNIVLIKLSITIRRWLTIPVANMNMLIALLGKK